MTNLTSSDPRFRIGILGCANIAKQFARDVGPSQIVRLAAVASRSADKAAAFAATFGIERSVGSYEALVEDPALDAVYIPLPNSLHAEWAIKAAACGKHVLCEKPLAVNLAEATAMFETARRHQVTLVEAYPYWFQPQTTEIVSLLRAGAIGNVRSVQASFGFTVGNPQQNIRLKPELAGGSLMDAGCYPLSLIRLAMGCAPVKVRADATWADTGVDLSMMATLFYADGRRAQLSCAMDAANHRHATIVGSQGTIETEYLNHTSDQTGDHPYGYLPSQLRLRRGIANSIPFDAIHSPVGSGFRFAAETFARWVRDADVAAIAHAEAMSLDIAATLEAIQASARSGQDAGVVAHRKS